MSEPEGGSSKVVPQKSLMNPMSEPQNGSTDKEGDGWGNTNPISKFWASILQADAPPSVVVTADDYSKAPFASILASIDNFFRITERGSSFSTEFWGGMTTFLSLSYIMVLNGIIIAGPFNSGMSVNGVFFATALASGLFTTMMGLFVNVPVALAPGMGLNGFFAHVAKPCPANPTGDTNGVQCPGWGDKSLPWADVMGAVFISGWFYLFFTFTGLRSMLFDAVPVSLRSGISVGIGFFITIIGLKIGEITRVTVAPWAVANAIPMADCYGFTPAAGFGPLPSTVAFCNNEVDLYFSWYELFIARFNLDPQARISVLGIVFATALELLKIRGSIIISIILATIIGINYWKSCDSLKNTGDCVTNLQVWGQKGGPKFVVDVSDIPSGKLSFKYIKSPLFWDCVFTFLFVELFDSFGTLTGIMTRAGFIKGDPKTDELGMKRVNRAMCVDGFGLCLGAIIGSNSITCFIESCTGVEAGARTGLASVFTGASFLLSLAFLLPFVQIIPDAATCCALVMVGIHSLTMVKDIDFSDFANTASCFLMIAIMGFTYSIANGICAGFIFFTWLRTVRYLSVKLFVEVLKWPTWGPEAGLDATRPHIVMYLISSFMVIRFVYLKA